MAKNRSADNSESANDTVDSGSNIDGVGNVNEPVGGSGGERIESDNDPESASAASGSGSGSRDDPAEPAVPKSRKRASTASASGSRKSGQAKAKLDLNGEARAAIAKQVVGVHKLVGIMMGMEPVVAITDEQGEALTEAVFAVADQYKIKPNPKTIAWLNLLAVASTIYVPKYMLIKMVIADQKSRQAQNPPLGAVPVNVENPPEGGMRYQ